MHRKRQAPHGKTRPHFAIPKSPLPHERTAQSHHINSLKAASDRQATPREPRSGRAPTSTIFLNLQIAARAAAAGPSARLEGAVLTPKDPRATAARHLRQGPRVAARRPRPYDESESSTDVPAAPKKANRSLIAQPATALTVHPQASFRPLSAEEQRAVLAPHYGL